MSVQGYGKSSPRSTHLLAPNTETVSTIGVVAWEQTKDNYKTDKFGKTELPRVAKKLYKT